MTHWSNAYIGKPWAPDADGPACFSCWGLVRHVFGSVRQIVLPLVPIAGGDSTAAFRAIRAAASISGWKPIVTKLPLEFDVVVLDGALGLHCGVIVFVNGRTCVLHSSHVNGVTSTPWSEFIVGRQHELWRAST